MEDLLSQIPYGLEAGGLVVSICALVSAIVPDSKMPAPVAAVLNFIGMNWGRARNDPQAN